MKYNIKPTNHFTENYSTIFSDEPKKQITSNKKNKRTCRFCGLTSNETAFTNISHAIPESIGNKNIICVEECDNCNKHFSEYVEVHFDKYTKPYRNISQIKGKNKVPSYKTKSKNARIDSANNILQVKANYKDNILFDDSLNNRIILKYELEPYIPEAVYKTFVKMALSVMPSSELKNFKEAIRWIMEKEHTNSLGIQLPIIISFIPELKKSPTVILLKRKIHINHPTWVFIVGFGNMSYQIILPDSLLLNNCTNEMITTKIMYHNCEEIQLQNFANSNTIKNEILFFPLSYE